MIRTKATIFKVVGYGVLLTAFIVQWTLLRDAQKRDEMLMNSLIGYSGATNSSLLYLNLYFTSAQSTGVANADLVKMAAEELALGKCMHLTAGNMSREDKVARINELLESASQVADLDTYNEFMKVVNASEQLTGGVMRDYAAQISDRESWSTWLYCIVFLLGSCLGLYGTYLDGRDFT